MLIFVNQRKTFLRKASRKFRWGEFGLISWSKTLPVFKGNSFLFHCNPRRILLIILLLVTLWRFLVLIKQSTTLSYKVRIILKNKGIADNVNSNRKYQSRNICLRYKTKIRNLRKIDTSIIKKGTENIPNDVLINIASPSFPIFSLLCDRSFQCALPLLFFYRAICNPSLSLSFFFLTVKRVIEQRPDLTWPDITSSDFFLPGLLVREWLMETTRATCTNTKNRMQRILQRNYSWNVNWLVGESSIGKRGWKNPSK